MKDEKTNAITSAEEEPFQQFEIALGQISSLDARGEDEREETPVKPSDAPVRTQEHMRRLGVAGLSGTDSRRTAKTEYVMRMLVSGRAPLDEPKPESSSAPEPRPKLSPAPEPRPEPKPKLSSAPEPRPEPKPKLSPAPEPRPEPKPKPLPKPEPPRGVMTLENLTFDDLLAELENL